MRKKNFCCWNITTVVFLHIFDEKWSRRSWFLWGYTPHTPWEWELLLGVNFSMDPYWRKSHTIARDATKSYFKWNIAKLAGFFICVGWKWLVLWTKKPLLLWCFCNISFCCIASNCMAYLQYGSIQKLTPNRSSLPGGCGGCPPKGTISCNSIFRSKHLKTPLLWCFSNRSFCRISSTCMVFLHYGSCENICHKWFFSFRTP